MKARLEKDIGFGESAFNKFMGVEVVLLLIANKANQTLLIVNDLALPLLRRITVQE